MNINLDDPVQMATMCARMASACQTMRSRMAEETNGERPGQGDVLAAILEAQQVTLLALASNFRMRSRYETQRVVVPPTIVPGRS